MRNRSNCWPLPTEAPLKTGKNMILQSWEMELRTECYSSWKMIKSKQVYCLATRVHTCIQNWTFLPCHLASWAQKWEKQMSQAYIWGSAIKTREKRGIKKKDTMYKIFTCFSFLPRFDMFSYHHWSLAYRRHHIPECQACLKIQSKQTNQKPKPQQTPKILLITWYYL